VAPYGVYDLGRNVGWVSVGVDHDTAAFAVERIRRSWRWMGTRSYAQAKRLLNYRRGQEFCRYTLPGYL
jgi:Rhodopirellula transposase DDE domain